MFGTSKAERQAAWERQALEAAAEYLSATIVRDDRRADAAVSRVPEGALMFGVMTIAQRAVSALAAELDTSPETVLQSLIAAPTT